MRRSNESAIFPKGRAPIRPELLAAKLAAMRNHQNPELLRQVNDRPKLIELLWFLQFKSIQPGGLVKFCEEMVEAMPERFGTGTLRANANGRPLSVQAKVEIFCEMRHNRPALDPLENGGSNLMDLLYNEVKEGKPLTRTVQQDWDEISSLTKGWTREMLWTRCTECAIESLPELFTALCIEKDRSFRAATEHEWTIGELKAYSGTWFMDDPIEAVFQMMELQAKQSIGRIAMTKVAGMIFDVLDYALSEKVMVRIEGDSRFGKTEALSAWVNMHPGRARLVRVPCDNSMTSLFKRIGEALGIDCSYGSNPSRLKDRIEYIIQHSGLFLVLDEAHFLAPLNFNNTTPPHRLNWVRTEIVDRGLPLAVAMTPQAFNGAIDRFVQKTKYDMTQFWGRDFLPCVLPKFLSEEDLVAVARIHFPEMLDSSLGHIATLARVSENYLQAVEAIARRSRFLASKRGENVTIEDVDTATSEVLYRLKPVAAPDGAESTVELEPDLQQQRGSLGAEQTLENNRLTTHERSVKPGFETVQSESLDNRSLRCAGPVRRSAGLVSVDA